jgi:hypothetical protein
VDVIPSIGVCRRCWGPTEKKMEKPQTKEEPKQAPRTDGKWCGSLTDMAWALEFGYRAHERGDKLIKAIEDMNAVLKK